MKSLITGGLALAIAACVVAPAWSASGVPQGSYLQSCRNVYLDSSSGKPKVYADCPDRQGNWHHSGTQYMKCSGDIANQDGELGCVGQGSGPGPSGGLPTGSWQQSCRQPELNGSMLTAACLRGSGGFNLSSLDIRACGGGPVGNRNGNLFCEGGGAPGNQGGGNAQGGQGNDQGNDQGGQGNEQGGQGNGQGGQGGSQGGGQGSGGFGQPAGAAGGMPAGSWQRSCRNPQLSESVLTANCQRRDGAFRLSALDLQSCDGGPVGNDNGRLVCETGGQAGGNAAPQGGGGLPTGSWQQSCRNPQINGSMLTASCLRRDGGSMFSALDVRSCPGGRVRNFDGSLACE